MPLGIFYEKMALIFYFKVQMKAYESIIPVEVGVGRKDKSQIAKAINRYKSEHGIVISNRISKIKKIGYGNFYSFSNIFFYLRDLIKLF